MYTRTLRIGEFVNIDGHEGTVVELGTFTTRVRTGCGEELTLPNSMVMGTVTRNYSRTVQGHGFILETEVTIGYDTPWRQVHAMLIEAARRTAGVLAEPAPRVFQAALSDFYPQYRLVCQAVPSQPRPRAEVLAALHQHLLVVRDIPLIAALTGVCFTLKHLDGRLIEVKSPPGDVIQPGSFKMIAGAGMPLQSRNFSHGDLIIQFNVVLPPSGSIARSPAEVAGLEKLLPGTMDAGHVADLKAKRRAQAGLRGAAQVRLHQPADRRGAP
jgi:hypothetical protein